MSYILPLTDYFFNSGIHYTGGHHLYVLFFSIREKRLIASLDMKQICLANGFGLLLLWYYEKMVIPAIKRSI